MNNIEQKVAGFIAENILFSRNGYSYPLDASFLENGIVDSMNILQLVMFVEENFPVKVGDSDIVPENFDSVEKIANFVRTKMN